MLIIERHQDESVVLFYKGVEVARVMPQKVRGQRVWLGFELPDDTKVLREELIARDASLSKGN